MASTAGTALGSLSPEGQPGTALGSLGSENPSRGASLQRLNCYIPVLPAPTLSSQCVTWNQDGTGRPLLE